MIEYIPQRGNGIIYCYILDDGKRYIGQTKYSLSYRHKSHLRGNQIIDRKLQSHTYELLVLKEVELNKLNDTEKEYIAKYNTIYPNGYNFTDGGGSKHTLSQDTRERISKGNMGKPKSNIARNNMAIARLGKSPWNKGISPSEETRKKISKTLKSKEHPKECKEALDRYYQDHDVWNKGKSWDENTRKKISEKLKGQKLSEETKMKMSISRKGRGRSVDATDKAVKTRAEHGFTTKVVNLDTGEVFDSINEAQRKYNCKNIYKVINGKTKTSGGQRWAKVH